MTTRVLNSGIPTPAAGVPRGAAWALLAGMALLGAAEAANDSGVPVALTLAALIVFAGLCILQLEAAFVVLLALTPFSVETFLRASHSAVQVPTEPMLFLALAAWGVRFLARRSGTFEQPRLMGWLLLGLGTILVSVVGADNRLTAIKATANATWYALFGVFIVNNFVNEQRLRALLVAWIGPGLVITLISLAMVMTGNYNHRTGFWWAYANFTEHGSFAAYLGFILAFTSAFTFESAGMARIGWTAASALVGLQVILSMTRGAWMGTAAFLLLLGLIYWRKLLRPGPLFAAVVAGAAILFALYVSGVTAALTKYTETTSQVGYTSNLERVNRWYAGWHMFRTHPVTGVGFGTYLNLYRNYRRLPLGTDQSAITMGVHSEYLKVLAETGLLGAAGAAAVLLTIIGLAWRAIRGAPNAFRRALAVGSAGGLLTYLVHGIVNNYLIYDKAAVPVWTCVGTLGALVSLNERDRATAARPDPRSSLQWVPGE